MGVPPCVSLLAHWVKPDELATKQSICKCIEHATGRQPDITLGKPDPNMLKEILDRHGLDPEEIAMVGDRIYTDTAMAHNAGAFGALVLSGETTLETAENKKRRNLVIFPKFLLFQTSSL